ILLICNDKNDTNLKMATDLLEKIGQRFSRDFDFKYCEITTNPNEIIKKATSAHAILFAFGAAQDSRERYRNVEILNKVANALGLYSHICYTPAFATNSNAQPRYAIVSDTAGGVAESGFRNNPTFGREAYDVLSYSELEIERVARIAYELAENSRRHVTLVDMANRLTTSKLWRKIVTDINEDYPYVSVNMLTAKDAASALLQDSSQFDIILTTSILGDMLSGICEAIISGNCNANEREIILAAIGDTALTAYFGETTLGMYGVNAQSQNPIQNMQFNAANNELSAAAKYANTISIMLSISMMLRHSLDMCDAAKSIECAVEKLLSENSATLEINENQIISALLTT
ncbi:MAG: hypothetical protein K2G31_06025, partial [Clostridia bacterium]|nr:hypothetical protein [Clostridia bacterium]